MSSSEDEAPLKKPRWQGKNFFLTYSQCPLDFNDVAAHLVSLKLARTYHLSSFVGCTELHEDGLPHLHFTLIFKRRCDIRNARVFDVEGFHPNFGPCTNLGKSINYTNKEAHKFNRPHNVLWYPDEETVRADAGGANAHDCDDLAALCAQKDWGEWLQYMHSHKVQYAIGKAIWEDVHRDDTEDVTEEWHDRTDVPSVFDCVSPELLAYEFDRSRYNHILWGHTSTGKTSWAAFHAPKPALLCTHVDGLKQFRIGYHRSIIFDECEFWHKPVSEQTKLVEYRDPRRMHIRNTTALIPGKVWKFFCANNYPFDNPYQFNKDPARMAYIPAVLNRVREYRVQFACDEGPNAGWLARDMRPDGWSFVPPVDANEFILASSPTPSRGSLYS